ncbi:adenylate/guanylate cyclase domain-containing protein [uncultured Fibrobacter sp.]|jgi:adenylate cyclase|uniref:adenylate/guanylate cyclase domain-containing protein n=1 Tax=uncultured Fibrobacter sp. TaxID=261512 RepID=UPI0025DC1F67|nr:adenylate/guanylate cyclase domain-containing protein [uncultured Fibrobacter sp.]
MAMTRLTARKFKAICYYLCSWIVTTLGLALLVQYGSSSGVDLGSLLFALQLGIFVGLSHGIYDIVILQDDLNLRSAWIALLVRSAFYITLIGTSFTLCVLLWGDRANAGLLTEEGIHDVVNAFANPHTHVQLFLLLFCAHLITFIRSVHKKFGTRVFVNTMLGKFQDPIEEDLVFMFIDMRRSTAIAEDLGHVTYSKFMKDYYKLLSNCCEENLGEIYQIAGDGVFITWKTSKCTRKARPVNLFFDFCECLEKTKKRFLKRYGIVPSFKAGAHCGKVISTEVGNFGSEMAYHGDVLNTTSRIQNLCTKLGQEFLISEDLFTILPKPFPHGYMSKKEGFFELRGKKKEILIFSLQRPLTDLN